MQKVANSAVSIICVIHKKNLSIANYNLFAMLRYVFIFAVIEQIYV